MSRRTAEKPIDGSIVPSAVYTQQEACELLRLGRVSLLRLRQRGELGYIVQLSSVRYTGRHLLDYLARCERKPKDVR
jgi:hypothetical protein